MNHVTSAASKPLLRALVSAVKPKRQTVRTFAANALVRQQAAGTGSERAQAVPNHDAPPTFGRHQPRNPNNAEHTANTSNASVYVGNLPYDTTEQQLRDLIGEEGQIERCHIFRSANGNSKGYASMLMSTPEEAYWITKKFHDYPLKGRLLLFLPWASARRNNDPTSINPLETQNARVFVGNLDFSVNDAQLAEVMSEVGDVVSCSVTRLVSGVSKGYARVEYKTPQQAQIAVLSLHDKVFAKRPMIVKLDFRRGFSHVDHTSSTVKGHPAFLSNRNADRSAGAQATAESSDAGPVLHRRSPLDDKTIEVTPEDKAEAASIMTRGSAVLDSQPNRRIWVGNLPFTLSSDAFAELMREAGTVLEAAVSRLANGTSKGYGVAEYSTPEEAERAIQLLHNREVLRRPLIVKYDIRTVAAFGSAAIDHKSSFVMNAAQHITSGYRFFVSGLNPEVNWGHLKDLLRQVGPVRLVRIITDEEGVSTGWGSAIFDREEDAKAAIERFDGLEINGMTLRAMRKPAEHRDNDTSI